MTKTIEIEEASGQTPTQVGKAKWLVTIAVPGKGTKGSYSADTLERTGPSAFPAGTKSFWKHAATQDRDARDQVGTFEEGAFWNEDEQKLQGILTVKPRYLTAVREGGKDIEASMKAQGRSDTNQNVKELLFRRDNTVDLVAFGGLEGSGLEHEIVESLFAAAAAEAELEEKKENNVEITEKMWDAQTALITGLATKFDTLTETMTSEKQGKADAEAVSAEVAVAVKEALAEIAETEAAIDAALIPVAIKESLKASARNGDDITESLAGAVSIAEAFKAEADADAAKAPKGRVRGTVVAVAESLDDEPKKTFKVGRWS